MCTTQVINVSTLLALIGSKYSVAVCVSSCPCTIPFQLKSQI